MFGITTHSTRIGSLFCNPSGDYPITHLMPSFTMRAKCIQKTKWKLFSSSNKWDITWKIFREIDFTYIVSLIIRVFDFTEFLQTCEYHFTKLCVADWKTSNSCVESQLAIRGLKCSADTSATFDKKLPMLFNGLLLKSTLLTKMCGLDFANFSVNV